MNQENDKVDQVKAESMEDLELTNQQADDTKAGSGTGAAVILRKSSN